MVNSEHNSSVKADLPDDIKSLSVLRGIGVVCIEVVPNEFTSNPIL
jgi:hypothetical protein